MSIKVHSLAYSRSVRIVWLLEELGQPYELVRYPRTEDYTAPEALRRIHPLGKSPIIEDGDLVLAESAAILRYIHARHGAGRFAPEPGTPEGAHHDEWLDYVEGSLSRPVGAAFWARRSGTELDRRSADAIALHMGYIDDHLARNRFLTGDALTLADMQISYLLAMARYAGVLSGDAANAYLDRLLELPAVIRAIDATGPVMPES
ncbi:glutathione S-transferase [Palleronia sp. LCG004]|uniref:glutathione S-transferase family protein n=1 Tax=Palleronia sp. LCG004 TaxID=3079304 RepID=UPI002941EAAD|nr:glutathione S-transferase [Palleronia sp. LCG004]WOI55197.1 glutathione S-transferase [Palleronia sp. LCG004]